MASCAASRARSRRPARIYDWVVENTFRNAKTLGCGVGDITSQ